MPQRPARKALGGRVLTDATPNWRQLSTETLVPRANSFIREHDIPGMKALLKANKTLWRVIKDRGVEYRLEFCEAAEPASRPRQAKPKQNGQGKQENKARTAIEEDASAEELRKLDLSDKEINEGSMYRLIFAECFRIDIKEAAIGGKKAVLEGLKARIQRKLDRQQNRMFERCWRKMASAGVIVNNWNNTAASVNINFRNGSIRDEPLRDAVRWANEQQTRRFKTITQ
jgi:hypothetical protein